MSLLLYIDGSMISYFLNLELIQVKVSLGLWNLKTRTKEYVWDILEYFEELHVTGARGRKIWADANHMEHHRMDTIWRMFQVNVNLWKVLGTTHGRAFMLR